MRLFVRAADQLRESMKCGVACAVMKSRWLVSLVLCAACDFPKPMVLPPDDPPFADASVDAAPLVRDHLLFSEINSISAEFIEIWNPTNRQIDLSNYYLTDSGNYWSYPTSTTVVPQSDFIVRFPAGASLSSGGVVTIALAAAAFESSFGQPATYAIDITTGPQAMRNRNVPSSPPTFTDAGEIVVLFYWNGESDLVQDVDIVLAGTSADTSPPNNFIPKQPVDGPDPDSAATAYKAEAGLLGGGMSSVAASLTSYKRRRFEVGGETQNGDGNGITGDDETSELLMLTWDGDAPNPHSPPTPGVGPNF